MTRRRSVRAAPGLRLLVLLPLLAACAAPQTGGWVPDLPGQGSAPPTAAAPATPPPVASVRHVSSTEPYGNGRLHLFLFTPEAPRPLDVRLSAARAAVSRDPACTWIDAPRDVILSETAKQGDGYADTLLVAPLDCT